MTHYHICCMEKKPFLLMAIGMGAAGVIIGAYIMYDLVASFAR